MSFIKRIWKKGDRLTAREMNRIENGIAAINKKQTLNEIIVSCKIIADDNSENYKAVDFSKTLNEIITLLQGEEKIIINPKVINSPYTAGEYFLRLKNIQTALDENENSYIQEVQFETSNYNFNYPNKLIHILLIIKNENMSYENFCIIEPISFTEINNNFNYNENDIEGQQLKIGTYNIGLYSYGASDANYRLKINIPETDINKNIKEDLYDLKVNNIKNFLEQENFDIIGIQERNSQFTSPKDSNYQDLDVFWNSLPNLNYNIRTHSYPNGLILCSKYPFIDEPIAGMNQRYTYQLSKDLKKIEKNNNIYYTYVKGWVRGTINIDDEINNTEKDIVLIDTHLSASINLKYVPFRYYTFTTIDNNFNPEFNTNENKYNFDESIAKEILQPYTKTINYLDSKLDRANFDINTYFEDLQNNSSFSLNEWILNNNNIIKEKFQENQKNNKDDMINILQQGKNTSSFYYYTGESFSNNNSNNILTENQIDWTVEEGEEIIESNYIYYYGQYIKSNNEAGEKWKRIPVLTTIEEIDLTSDQKKEIYLKIFNPKIEVINIQIAQMMQLCQMTKNLDNVIIFADWNTLDGYSDFNVMSENGFTMLNGEASTLKSTIRDTGAWKRWSFNTVEEMNKYKDICPPSIVYGGNEDGYAYGIRYRYNNNNDTWEPYETKNSGMDNSVLDIVVMDVDDFPLDPEEQNLLNTKKAYWVRNDRMNIYIYENNEWIKQSLKIRGLPNMCLDNIAIKGDILYNNSHVAKEALGSLMSDHLPYIAEITV